ncbi:glycoprotein Xg isoform X5 [Chrysemys picta bellii]|uniref:glycoprotein Xg isoform X5 n=1 Tax=Chrysemys picta bellii TaxID=8478 RepID=UPI0032B1E2AE
MQRGRLTLLVSLAFLLLHVRGEDDFNLEDALGPEPTKKPGSATKKPELDDHPKPQPGSKDNTGGSFKDEDLVDGKLPPEKRGEGDTNPKSGGDEEGDQENVNMESQQGAHAEPPGKKRIWREEQNFWQESLWTCITEINL